MAIPKPHYTIWQAISAALALATRALYEARNKGPTHFDLEDVSEELADDGRTLIRRFVKGDAVKEFRHKLKIPLYRGIYKSDIRYNAADMVTRGGSIWYAQADTAEPPGGGSKDWILSVKQGERGRNA